MKLIIITSQRSGSNFLRQCLNTHPQIVCDGELLIGGQILPPKFLQDRRLPAKIYKYLKARAWNPIRTLETFYMREDAPVVAFKAMYNQLANPKVTKFIQDHKDIGIIHLRRENLLKQYVSKVLIGKKRERRWQPHTTKKLPPVTTYISPEKAIAEMTRVQNYFREFEEALSLHNKIELIYEEMIDGSCLSDQATCSICNLLRIEVKPMCCNFVKINPNQLALIVENYQELADALSGSRFADFLD